MTDVMIGTVFVCQQCGSNGHFEGDGDLTECARNAGWFFGALQLCPSCAPDIGLSRTEWRALCKAAGLAETADVETLTGQVARLSGDWDKLDEHRKAIHTIADEDRRRANDLADRCGELESELAKATDENTLLRGLLHRLEEKAGKP